MTQTRLPTAVLVLCLGAAACAPRVDPAARAAEAARNEGPLDRSTVRVFDASVELDAMTPPTVSTDTAADGTPRTLVSAKLARFATMTCAVTKGRIDPGVALGHVVAQLREAPRMRVAAAGDVPVLFVASAANADRPSLAAIAVRTTGTMACAMDAFGHEERFERVAMRLAEGALPPDPPAIFRDVRVLRLDAKVTGFEVREIAQNGDARVTREWMTFVLPSPGTSTFRIVDALHTSVLDADARVLRMTEVVSANGKLLKRETVRRSGANAYTFELSDAERHVATGTFRSELLSTELGMAPRLRALKEKKSGELRFDEWDDQKKAVKAAHARLDGDRLMVVRGMDDQRCEPDMFGLCSQPSAQRIVAIGLP